MPEQFQNAHTFGEYLQEEFRTVELTFCCNLVAQVAATMFSVPVEVPPSGEYVADGAARQAAWALSGTTNPPEWSSLRAGTTTRLDPSPVPIIRVAYAAARTALYG